MLQDCVPRHYERMNLSWSYDNIMWSIFTRKYINTNQNINFCHLRKTGLPEHYRKLRGSDYKHILLCD